MSHIVFGAPTWHREWILDRWYIAAMSSVLNACNVNEELKNPLTTASSLILMEPDDPSRGWCDKQWMTIVYNQEPPQSRQRRYWGPKRFEHMATIRNKILDKVREIQPDYFLSVDTDILLHPNAVTSLVQTLENYDVDAVGGRCYMKPHGNTAPSHGFILNGQGFVREDVHDVIETEVIMAIKLMRPSAYNVDYEVHDLGEDIGWSLACKRQGLKLAYDGRVANKHVMNPEMLQMIDPRCGF